MDLTQRTRYFPAPVLHAAQASERSTGVRACVTLAQWALESAYGTALSGRNNPFGIKAYGATAGTIKMTWEVIKGKVIKTPAKFRDFATLAEAFTFHGRMLANPAGYYKKALPLRKDWRAYIKAIAPTYATDPAYAQKLITLVERWHLYDYNLADAK